MSQPERLTRRGEPQEEQEHHSRSVPPTDTESLLALQRSAGNQAVARQLQRYYEHPTWTRAQPGPPHLDNGRPTDPGWKENDLPPVGQYFVKEGDKWFTFTGGSWEGSPGPNAPEVPKTAVVADVGAAEPEEEYVHEPEAEFSARGHAAMEHVFAHLDDQQLVGLRELDKAFRLQGSDAFRERLAPRMPQKLKALSSLEGPPLQQQYNAAIHTPPPDTAAEDVVPTKRLMMAVHQINEEVVQAIIHGFPDAVEVFRGEAAQGSADRTEGKVDYKTVEGPSDKDSSKMHNKAIVGVSEEDKGQFLLSGSPNLSKGAMEENTESAVSVKFAGIAQMYKEYIEHIRDKKTVDKQFSGAVQGFNETNPVGIRAALAPFVDIGETLNAELKGSDEVVVRMYLVGQVKENDPVATLCKLAKGGANVSVIVDHLQASTTPYVRSALQTLQTAGVKVFAEKPKRGGAIMHDKLVFAHHAAAEAKEGQKAQKERWTVMVGSSGLTRNVIEGTNYENLLIIDDEKLYRAFQAHSKKGEGKRTAGIPEIKPSSPLGKVQAKLKAAIPNRNSPHVAQSVIKKSMKRAELEIFDDVVKMLGMVKTSTGVNKPSVIGYPPT